MFNIRLGKVPIWFLLFIQIQVSGLAGHLLRDQTSPRTNTLFDDADDIQRQLDNEARDRIKCGKPRINWPDITEMSSIDLTLNTDKPIQPFLWGRMLKLFPDAVGNRVVEVSPKTIWVFHFPTRGPPKMPYMNSDHYMKKSSKEKPRGVSGPLRYRSGLQDDHVTDLTKPYSSLPNNVKDSIFAHPSWVTFTPSSFL